MKQNLTPMMQQYFEIKEQHKDCILFFRMGDFYEMFLEDALIASNVLGIALTKRGKNENGDIAMCGIPYHASESYLVKLVNNGYKVAICEQLESPEDAKKRGYKAIVKREVVRIVTAGTVVEESLLSERKPNYLMAISRKGEDLSVSYVDASTGQLFVSTIKLLALSSELARVNPVEVLLSEKTILDEEYFALFQEYKNKITQMVDSYFDYQKVLNRLLNYYKVSTIESFGDFTKLEIESLGALVEYLCLTQKSNIPHISKPKKLNSLSFMTIDALVRKNLEISEASNDKLGLSLLDVLDQTKTAAGARLLRNYLTTPLIDITLINKRLDAVEFFLKRQDLRDNLRKIMAKISDTSRILTRLMLYKAGPRDLVAIKNDLVNFALIKEELMTHNALAQFVTDFDKFIPLVKLIDNAIIDEPPYSIKEGNYVKKGFNSQLDELLDINIYSNKQIDNLRSQYAEETGINNIKIQSNNMLGYFIEITPSQLSKIDQSKFIMRQSLVNCIRFTTPELQEVEQKINQAANNRLEIEHGIFFGIVEEISLKYDLLEKVIHRCSFLDFATNVAKISAENKYVRPSFTNDETLIIVEGRHPIVETLANKNHQDFTANNVEMSKDSNIIILTGPNMGGKSTYIRQIAVISIMAQAGFFVPAQEAKIGIIDRVFSRVGASDDIATGRSTFMVEMVETATILNQATSKSLIILDEIGRGTSTGDGLAIAQSVVEYIHDKIGARTIFATHYHELASLSATLKGVLNKTVQVKEWEGNIIFLHKIIDGIADKSYGVNVASLAGLPASVIERANKILAEIS